MRYDPRMLQPDVNDPTNFCLAADGAAVSPCPPQHVSDGAWDAYRRNFAAVDSQRGIIEQSHRDAGIVLVTVAEWDARGQEHELGWRAVADSLKAECDRLDCETRIARESQQVAIHAAEEANQACKDAIARGMELSTTVDSLQAENARLRRILNREQEPTVPLRPAYRWSPLV